MPGKTLHTQLLDHPSQFCQFEELADETAFFVVVGEVAAVHEVGFAVVQPDLPEAGVWYSLAGSAVAEALENDEHSESLELIDAAFVFVKDGFEVQ